MYLVDAVGEWGFEGGINERACILRIRRTKAHSSIFFDEPFLYLPSTREKILYCAIFLCSLVSKLGTCWEDCACARF